MPLIVLSSFVLLLIVWWLTQPVRLAHRRRQLAAQPFPAAWREILKRNVPLVRSLPADLQLKLKKSIQIFVGEKNFIGCGGLRITDEIRVTVAAQACLLVLGHQAYFYPKVHEILVYPDAFVVNRVYTDSVGVLQNQSQVLSGESWAHGQVILSWSDARDGAAVADDGRNVVIHEFAHQLDQANGYANGAPDLVSQARYQRWSRVFGAEFVRLQESLASGEGALLDRYAATSPAEFFAVSSEVFFEQPRYMAAELPAVYGELVGFYRLDPLSWS